MKNPNSTFVVFALIIAFTLVGCAGPAQTPPRPATPSSICKRPMPSLSALEQAVIAQINVARTNPTRYVKLISKQAVDNALTREAIQFLKKVKPVPALHPSACLCLSARDHVQNTGPKGTVGHEGFSERVHRYLSGNPGYIGENVSYGRNSAEEMVMDWIIDKGVASRQHRKNIFNPAFANIGVACGPHAKYRHMCTTVFSER